MRCSKKIILFLVCFATVFSFLTVSASADWNADVGYYGNVPFQVLVDKRDAGNHIIGDDNHRLEIDFDTELQCYRLRYVDTGAWYLNTDGSFPYTIAQGDIETDVSSPSVQSANGWWLPNELSDNVEIKSLSLLESMCANLITDGHDCRLVETLRFGGHHWVIQDYSTDGGANRIYGTSDRRAYAAIVGDSATDIERDYLDADGDSVGGTKVLDINGNTFTVIDDSGAKINLDIGSLNYDAGDQSYTVNAYTTVYEGDNYYYTYYTYNITYNITNTYVTYIGSNDAYEKEEYEYYYQLPDGRSSADLTADEVAGMSFEFHDVVNYAKSATDVSVRALYHFDGDTEDSSYFSTQGAFEWTEGASITYMEAPEAFDGTLYLDNTSHSFDIELPSSIGSTDFTLQFRYYQVSEPDTQDNVDNYIEIGGVRVFDWDEQNLSRGGSVFAPLPIGTWNEFAIVRRSGTGYVYVNGLCVHTFSFNSVLYDTIRFCFGNSSRAYSMIDELRVLNFALTEGGASYTPTNVPHDSNLVLVLPDSARPIADEYWSWDTTITPLYAYDLTSLGYPSTSFSWSSSGPKFKSFDETVGTFYSLSPCSVYAGEGSYTFTGGPVVGGSGFPDMYIYGGKTYLFYGGTALPLTSRISELTNSAYLIGDYTLTLVDSSGRQYSMTFNAKANGVSGSVCPGAFGWMSSWLSLGDAGRCRFVQMTDYNTDSPYYKYYSQYILFDIYEGQSIDLVYLELVKGSVGNTGHEKVTCIYPEAVMQPNTAAVQSIIPVNGYTVGGVRPTLPAKGDVWFPVSENRIQTCYIYTGSMWEEVGCRWYTGSRWIPIYAFDLTTLEDLFDIADASTAVPPITSESAFWRWWQLQWLDFRNYLDGKFDELIVAITGSSDGSTDDGGGDPNCKHVYSSEVVTDPDCATPGTQSYTCTLCGHKYTEQLDSYGHDWHVTEDVSNSYELPSGAACPECQSTGFTHSINDDFDDVTCICTACGSEWHETPDVTWGYVVKTCSRCGVAEKDSRDPDSEPFSLLGLVESITSAVVDVAASMVLKLIDLITELFKMFIEAVLDFIGGLADVFTYATGHIATLGDNVAPIGDFVRGVYDAIPDDIEAVLTGSFVVVIVASVISFLL